MGEKVKKPFYKKWWVWVIAIIVIFAVSSGGEEETAQPVSTDIEAEASAPTEEGTTEEQTEEPAKEEFDVGEKVQLGDNILTVTEVEKSNGSDFDKPKDGMEYVIVSVQIENGGDKNIRYNPFDFKMQNSQGQIVDQAFTIINSDTSLSSGELASGGTVSGTIAFEQPAGDTGLQLQYSASFWSNKTVKVNIQ